MRWELTRTGGLADIAFMVVDVVQREKVLGDTKKWACAFGCEVVDLFIIMSSI